MLDHSGSRVGGGKEKMFSGEHQLFSQMYVFCRDTRLDDSSLSFLLLGVAMCPYASLRHVCRRELCCSLARAFETSPVLGFMLFLLPAN